MENKLEKKVYSSWAFKEFESEKAQINRELCEELKSKYKISKIGRGRVLKNLDEFDIVFEVEPKYGKTEYRLIKNKTTLSIDELALIADDGNLCFGHFSDYDAPVTGTIITVWTD